MATSAFKSTTKRTPVVGTPPTAGDSASATSKAHHRRSRSLSQFSRRLPELTPDVGEVPAPRGRFVNTVRGSGFPEISLDDLAIEFFPLKKDVVDERESSRSSRSSRRNSEISPSTASVQRRGRSVSRHSNGSTVNGGGTRAVPDTNSRRRRSVSVARQQICDSESDMHHSQSSSNHSKMSGFSSGSSRTALQQKPTTVGQRRLGRSLSQKDLLRSHDGYSSQSSALTDDESKDADYGKKDTEKTIRAVYAQKKSQHPTGDDANHGLYEAMRKELRYAVEEIKTELEQAMTRKPSTLESHDHLQLNNSNVFKATFAIRKNYATKLEQSVKRKQDLLAEMALEEQRGKELSKIVRDLVPDSKSSDVAQRPARSRKRSNDKSRMSKRLNEEAEKYFEDFISNVEDTDFSSFDGERSDTSSTLGGITKPRDSVLHDAPIHQSPGGYNSLPVEMDGVNLPWLKWETSNDGSPLSSKSKMQLPITPKTLLWDAPQDVTLAQDPSCHSTSSRGSCSPDLVDSSSMNTVENSISKSREIKGYQTSRFDMDEYLKLKSSEDLLFESWRERNRTSCGGLLLCGHVL